MSGSRSARILIVDDEQGPRESLRMILAPDHDVLTAGDGVSALEILRTTPVDLVTVDLNMPGMRGDELMRCVREEFPHVEIVVITGYGTLETAVEGLRFGICDYLSKPFDVVQVGAAVGRALARRRSRVNLLQFLEGLGEVLGKDRDAGELLAELESDSVLQARLRAVLEEPAVDPAARRDGGLDPRTLEFLEVLAETIEYRDATERGHARRVSFLAGLIAERLGLPPEEREHVRISAFLHDLGKVAFPPELLGRMQHLGPDEQQAIEDHTVIGERLVRPLGFASTIGAALRHHHERWDGEGYPDGLRGESIPLASRIIAVADAFDAMTGPRPRGPIRRTAEALVELRKAAGSQFDPALVKEFVAIVETGACDVGRDATDRKRSRGRGKSKSAWSSAPGKGDR